MEEKFIQQRKKLNQERYSHETTLSIDIWFMNGTLDESPNLFRN